MLKKILIANRGEIAVRIIRACKELGVKSVLICPTIEKEALPSIMADELVLTDNRRVYLDIPAIIQAAKDSGAEAIHPGYGFLAENAEFASQCVAAGLAFIGPSAEAIKVMGEKTLARKKMQEAGVPVTPGSGVLENAEEAATIAAKLGYPVMIKASAGGGGRGIRIVHNQEQLATMIAEAQKEAQLAFNCADVYLEKYMEQPRHVEIQVLADSYGNTVHLGERECSIQRRRQKLIEEAPSVAVSAELREQMGEVAVRAAKAVNYCGAGTVEFLLDKGQFYFMEMNTRIQVEHPVTEMITGIDLIKEQIKIAAGEKLSFQQSDVKFTGWAMECRINAEDPELDFRPTPGKIIEFNPPLGPWTRLDTCAFAGYTVSPFFDSMMGKLIVWGKDREEAMERLSRALDEFHIAGVKTSKPVFQDLLKDSQFRAGDIHVNFLEGWLSKKSN